MKNNSNEGLQEGTTQILKNQRMMSRLINSRVSLGQGILIAAVCVVLTGIVHWNVGYPLSKFLGFVPDDTLSGAGDHREIASLRKTALENKALYIDLKKHSTRVTKAKNKQVRDLKDTVQCQELLIQRLQLEAEQFELAKKILINAVNNSDAVSLRAELEKEKSKRQLLQAWYTDDPQYVDGSNPRYKKVSPADRLLVNDEWFKYFLENCENDGRTNMLNYLNMGDKKQRSAAKQNQ